jgi:hypothetical protein
MTFGPGGFFYGVLADRKITDGFVGDMTSSIRSRR